MEFLVARFSHKTALFFLAVIFCLFSISCAHLKHTELSPEDYAKKKMVDQQFSPAFIAFVLEHYNYKDRDDIISINLQGFLKRADYSGHYSALAVKRCKEFMHKHAKALAVAEKRYGVSKEVIASLIWVETKFGKTMGTHWVPSVFFTLLQSDHPDMVRMAYLSLDRRIASAEDNVKERMKTRAEVKAEWAMGELKALEKMFQDRKGNLSIRGSFAGAFGLPQFLPSSYLQWARPLSEGKVADIFQANDAITSVGFYLQSNGWKGNDPASQKAALFHYNRSEGYGSVILKIAESLIQMHR